MLYETLRNEYINLCCIYYCELCKIIASHMISSEYEGRTKYQTPKHRLMILPNPGLGLTDGYIRSPVCKNQSRAYLCSPAMLHFFPFQLVNEITVHFLSHDTQIQLAEMRLHLFFRSENRNSDKSHHLSLCAQAVRSQRYHFKLSQSDSQNLAVLTDYFLRQRKKIAIIL